MMGRKIKFSDLAQFLYKNPHAKTAQEVLMRRHFA
jgi:hypothetical protein